ncbi:hypothetical protein ACH4FX_42075 [Streptomyces sp. NPDC018019]|uniref:hypothetical protein n=1 Tax=Streptomyces sp. NPDC018019 TaxID=3365030 RepID=UPI0037B333C0
MRKNIGEMAIRCLRNLKAYVFGEVRAMGQCVPAHLAHIAARIPDSEHVTQPGAAHTGFLEKKTLRGAYVCLIPDFMARVEARA